MYLRPDTRLREIRVLERTDSTNTRLKEFYRKRLSGSAASAEAGGLYPGPCPVLLTAISQTAGRGRQGKSFFSEQPGGIYMSLGVPLHREPQDCLFLTCAAAVAICRVLEKYLKEQPEIKWVNDIWLGDRKLAGILTEAVSCPDRPELAEYAVTGIGINLNVDISRMPPELCREAVSAELSGELLPRVIAEISDTLLELSGQLDADALRQEYAGRSMIIGRRIRWEDQGMVKTGTARSIDRDGGLVIDEAAGGRTVLRAGLVSVRPAGNTGGNDDE